MDCDVLIFCPQERSLQCLIGFRRPAGLYIDISQFLHDHVVKIGIVQGFRPVGGLPVIRYGPLALLKPKI